MILVDSNIPMYLVGAEHPHKRRAQSLLDTAITRGDRLTTDAEVLQEILHRYSAIGRLDAIQPAFDAVLGLVDEVIAIDVGTALAAKDILLTIRGLSARDAIHVAAMRATGIDTIMTFDAGFDAVDGIDRLC